VKERLATRGGRRCQAHRRPPGSRRRAAEGRDVAAAVQRDRKRLSKEIGGKRSRGESSDELESQVREIGDQIAELNRATAAADEQQRRILLRIPNLPHPNAPVGKDASDNPVVRSWGEKPQLAATVLDHVAIGSRLEAIRPGVAAAKLSGSGFICFNRTRRSPGGARTFSSCSICTRASMATWR
jgi:seryl-tRNA synthetase